MTVGGVSTIEELAERTRKDGEVTFKLSEDVALRLYVKVGWTVMEVMTMVRNLTNVNGNEVSGIVVEAPLGEPAVNALIQTLQQFRVGRR